MNITKVPIIQIIKNGETIEVNPLTSVNDIGISSGTLKLDTSIVKNELSFGELISSQFSVQLFNIDDNLEGCDIQLFLEEDGVRTSKFKGIIDSSKRDNIGGYRDIIAYDWIYYNRDYDISNWWNNFWVNTRTNATIQEIRQSLITYIGFINDSKTYVNDSIVIPNNFNFYTDLKLSVILKMICELQAIIPHIDEDGNLEFISFSNTTSNLTNKYEGSNSKWEDYTTELITGVGIYSTSNDLSQLIGTTDNVYNISGNLFALTLNAQTLNTLGNNILNAISSIQFTPSKIKMIVSDFDLKLGQRVSTPKGYGYVMTNSLSGVCLIEQTIESKSMGSKLSQRVDSRNDTLIEGAKMSKFKQTIDGFTTEVQRIDNNASTALSTANNANTTAITAQSQVTQMADNIVLKVDNNGNIVKVALSADASTGSTFKVTADNISFFSNGVMELSANNLQINSTNFSVDASGNITAVSGTIGGWTIGQNGLYKNLTDPANDYTTVGTWLSPNIGLITNFKTTYSSNTYYMRSALWREQWEIDYLAGNNLQDIVLLNSLFYTNPQNIKSVMGQFALQQYNLSSNNLMATCVQTPYRLSFADTINLYKSSYGLQGISLDATASFIAKYATASRVAIFDASKNLVSSSITTTQLGYLSGVTSAIQTQIDDKQDSLFMGNPTATDFNELTTPGIYWINLSTTSANPPFAANSPFGDSGYGFLEVWRSSSNRGVILQRFTKFKIGAMAERMYANAQWYAWNNKAYMWTDGEGGNIQIVSPSGTYSTQMDMYDDTTFRMYHSSPTTEVAGGIYHSYNKTANLDYLDGVTSNIQTQINNKVAKSGDTMSGVLTMNNTRVIVKDTNITTSTNPSSNIYGDGYYLHDSASTDIGRFRAIKITDSKQGLQLEAVRKVSGTNYYNTLNMFINSSGTKIVEVSDPEAWRSAIGAQATMSAGTGISISGTTIRTRNLAGTVAYPITTTATKGIGLNWIQKYSDSANLQLQVYGTGASFNITLWSSDERLKEHIKEVNTEVLPLLNNIKTYSFDFKDKGYGTHTDVGLIAQQLKEYIPEAVLEVPQGENAEYESLYQIDANKMIPYLVKAIQEQQRQIDNLKQSNIFYQNIILQMQAEIEQIKQKTEE